MSVFINQAAFEGSHILVECRLITTLEYEDGLFREMFNVFHYHNLTDAGPLNKGSLLAAFINNVGDPIAPLMNVRVTLGRADIRIMDNPLDVVLEQALGSPSGAVTGDPLSASLALVMQFDSGVRGRSFRGRKHFGGLSESDSDGGDELKASVITSWGSPAAGMGANIDDGTGNEYEPCVLSPTLSSLYQDPPFFTGAAGGTWSVNHILGTMRKRKERVPA